MKAFSIFKKAEKKADAVKLYFPENKLEDLYRLLDQENAQKSLSAKFRLWSFIASIFPQTKEGPWRLSKADILNPYVEQI